jgi:hypothetical protein
MKGLAPLEDHERPAFHQGITALFPDDDAFHRRG